MGRKKSSIGCLFWTALVLLVLVVFLFNKGTIESVVEKTGLLTYLRRDKEPKNDLSVERTEESDEVAESAQDNDDGMERVAEPVITPEEEEDSGAEPNAVIVVEEDAPEESVPPPEPSKKIRRSRVFFVNVDENGSVSLKGIVRPVYYIDSPLTDTLKSLLQGLSADDVRSGLLSLVPEGTELRGIAIREGTAYIDFNESFRFNSFGGEGYKSQLQQIVYTATEFQTVKSVQVLVNGERLSYLGPESPYVGDPLSRESL